LADQLSIVGVLPTGHLENMFSNVPSRDRRINNCDSFAETNSVSSSCFEVPFRAIWHDHPLFSLTPVVALSRPKSRADGMAD
jgi:hypothetical protein